MGSRGQAGNPSSRDRVLADSLIAAEDTHQILGAEIRGEIVDLDDVGQLIIADVWRSRFGPIVVEAG